ncbi:MAG: helix-turn-helix transcriptional regulator [Bacteroidota bacterium]
MNSSQTFDDQETLAQIGRLVKSHRLQKGWTQLDLAVALENHRTQIARIERGEQDVRICTLSRIAQVLEIPLDVLIGHINSQSE